jgi:DNA-binding NtrC family response regulator
MASLSTQIQPRALLSQTKHNCLTLKRHVQALVVVSHLEDRQPLVRILEAIPADVIACSSRSQAEEVLSRRAFEIVFCDERLPDGRYSDLLHFNRSDNKIPRVVVLTRSGDWELYLEAVNKGAFDVIRTPGYPTDVEMTVIRAVHEDA